MKKIKHNFGENVIIYEGAKIHKTAEIGEFSIIYPNVEIGENVKIKSSVIIGKKPYIGKNQVGLNELKDKTIIGSDVFVGDQVIIYFGCAISDGVYLADKSLIRENVVLDKNVVIGTSCVVSFNAHVGENTKVMTGTNLCGNIKIGKNSFIGVHVCTVTDNNPQLLADRGNQQGPIIEDNVFIGSNTTILPGVKINYNITVASGSIVSRDLERPNSFYLGSPAKFLKNKQL